ncbi:protein FAR1-RELATED SEQUENCE 8-like [Tripterygium wilfordii]|uniref:protein FAR1-RELATED SEQUENCE 8-like n=1 Tax=Tripterygium wilfordii TaxID=458696 RepID=UPI0018F8569A|nr:protein FAR1-RELATED SEQUENCE 8-like [Tripterygium wilfordii]
MVDNQCYAVGDKEVINVISYQSPEVVANHLDSMRVDFKDIVPTSGMKFESETEMFDLYKKYGELNGFPVKRRTSNKDKDGMCKYVTFTCGRSGKLISRSKNVISHHPTQKNGCKARLRARISTADEKWEITSFEDQHNHALSPNKARPNKSHNAQVIATGGHDNLPFLQRDTSNLIAKVRRMRMGEGDANAIQGYFAKIRSKNEGFFSLIDWDEEERLKSVFWDDPRSRAACREFGDIVTFDTTYLTNQYDMPFVPFVGVNHHGHSILLGCGLVSNEDTNTFIWLFRTWLTCMYNVPEKLGSFKKYVRITYAMGNAIFDSQSVDQFECGWKLMVEKFRLEDNAWLSSLYEDREIWTTLKQFVEQYNNALRDKVEKESLVDYNSLHKQLQFVTSFEMEKQIQKLYTESKFKEFQSELCGMMYCGILDVENIGDSKVFNVEEDIAFGENYKKKVIFKVLFVEGTLSVKCTCYRYEFRGILCRHVIIVFIRSGQYLVPDNYIFTRWRKDVRRCHSRVKINYEGWIVTMEQL